MKEGKCNCLILAIKAEGEEGGWEEDGKGDVVEARVTAAQLQGIKPDSLPGWCLGQRVLPACLLWHCLLKQHSQEVGEDRDISLWG